MEVEIFTSWRNNIKAKTPRFLDKFDTFNKNIEKTLPEAIIDYNSNFKCFILGDSNCNKVNYYKKYWGIVISTDVVHSSLTSNICFAL